MRGCGDATGCGYVGMQRETDEVVMSRDEATGGRVSQVNLAELSKGSLVNHLPEPVRNVFEALRCMRV